MLIKEYLNKIVFLFLSISGIILAKGFLIPLCIGGVLATLFLPVCKWLESKGISKFLAVSMCVISFLLAIALVFAVVVGQVASISQDFTILQARLLKITANIQDLLLDKVGISIDSQMKVIGSQKDYFNNLIVGTAGSVLSMLFQFGLILVYLFGLLYYRLHIKSFLLQLFTLNSKNLAETTLYKVSLVSQQYLLGLAKMIVLLWFMYGIGFSIIGIKNALFFAVLCGILEIVPFVGNIVGTAITVFVAAAYGSSNAVLIAIVGVYGLVQFIQGWFLEPLILGPQVKVNPLFTIIALILGELIWGLPGVFLAIPLMGMLKIICDSIAPLKPYGFLIGPSKLNPAPS